MNVCSIEGCERGGKLRRGWCSMHHQRWLRHKTPRAAVPPRAVGAPLAWLEELAANPRPCGEADWPFGTMHGYGWLRYRGRSERAHRVILLLTTGSPPEGKPFALHACDRRICCAPGCLRWGSAADNHEDMVSRGRRVDHVGELNGHAKLTDEQVRIIRALPTARTIDLAICFGVSKHTVEKARSGATWKHLERVS